MLPPAAAFSQILDLVSTSIFIHELHGANTLSTRHSLLYVTM